MRKRHPNPRLAKIHRNYTVEEVASLFGIHRNTVREWVKRGLPTSDGRRPMLILGRDLVAFLSARRAKNKRTCPPGELYCVRCRQTGPARKMAAEAAPKTQQAVAFVLSYRLLLGVTCWRRPKNEPLMRVVPTQN